MPTYQKNIINMNNMIIKYYIYIANTFIAVVKLLVKFNRL